MAERRIAQQQYLIELQRLLMQHFNLEELKQLCFSLGLDYDSLPGDGKVSKSRELVQQITREGRISELDEQVRALRPNAPWPPLPLGRSDPPPPINGGRDGCRLQITVVITAITMVLVAVGYRYDLFFPATATSAVVTITPTSSATPTLTPTLTSTPTPTSTLRPYLDVKDGPGLLFSTIGRIQEGQEVETEAQYTNRDGETWYQIELANGQEGWVFSGSIAPSPLHNLKPVSCFYAGSTVEETLSNLINAEGEAVEQEDIAIIFLIFGQDAQISKADSPPKTWLDAMQYYQEKFTTEEHFRVDHSPFHLQSLTAERAFAITGSSGEWTWERDLAVVPSPTPMSYTNLSGSDHWTFGRNDSGCWVITDFIYNASHITPTP